MANGDSVFVSGDSNRTYVNGYQFLNSEATASNGMMLALQNVLIPPHQNLAQMVSRDTSLSFFNQAIQLATPCLTLFQVCLRQEVHLHYWHRTMMHSEILDINSPADLNLVSPDTLRNMVLSRLIPQRLFSNDIADSSTYTTVSDSTLIFYTIGIRLQFRSLEAIPLQILFPKSNGHKRSII